MNPDLQKEIFARIDAFAAKLGVGAAYVWTALIKQAYVVGATDLLILLFTVAFCVWLLKWVVPHTKVPKMEVGEEFKVWKARADAGENWEIIVFFLGLFALGMIVVVLFHVEEIIGCFFNPAYYALKTLKEAL